MSWLVPLPVVLPLLAAALNVALDHVTPRWLHTAITLAAVTAALLLLFTEFIDEYVVPLAAGDSAG